MEIRQLTADEFEASTELSEYAFIYKLSPEARQKRREAFLSERYWGVFDENRLQAKLQLLPLQLYINGKPVQMGGIAGVATWPESRRQGYVNRLLFEALNEMNKQGRSLSCLHPFSVPFYRKFGWELYTDYKKYTIPVHKFPQKTACPGVVKRDFKDLSVLGGLYDSFAKRYNGTLVRDAKWWQDSVLDDETHTGVYFSDSGTPEGYVLYKLANRELAVNEFVFMHETARKALWTYLANHDSMVTGAVLNRVPGDDVLPLLWEDPRFQQETKPFFMARIVNAAEFVGQYAFQAPSEPGGISVGLQLQDSFASWNDGSWTLHVDQAGNGMLEQAAGRDALPSAQAECDIKTLTAMLLGYKRPQELFLCERLTGSEAAVQYLERLIPRRTTALLDFF